MIFLRPFFLNIFFFFAYYYQLTGVRRADNTISTDKYIYGLYAMYRNISIVTFDSISSYNTPLRTSLNVVYINQS